MNIAYEYKCNHCKVKICDPPEFHHSRMADRTKAAGKNNNEVLWDNDPYYLRIIFGIVSHEYQTSGGKYDLL